MDRTDGISDDSDLGIGNLRIDCRESRASFHRNEAKHAAPGRARCTLGRASSCRDTTREDLRLRCRQLFGPSKTSINEQTIASDRKSYLNVGGMDFHPIYCENAPFGANLVPRNAQLLPMNRGYCVESAQGFHFKRPIANGLKSPSSFDVIRLEEGGSSFKNTKYINSHLVQKVLGSQMALSRTRKMCLVEEGEASRTNRLSAGQKCYRHQNPRHHLSDQSLHDKAVDSGVRDFDTVSSESQKESGYQSGDSVFDCLSATGDSVDLNQPAISIPDWTKLSLAQSGRSGMCADF